MLMGKRPTQPTLISKIDYIVRSYWSVIILVITAVALILAVVYLNNSLAERTTAFETRERAIGLIRPFNRLIREELRLALLISNPIEYDESDIQLQRDLINSRLFELSTSRSQRRMGDELLEVFNEVEGKWLVLQPEMDRFLDNTTDEALRQHLLAELAELERVTNRSDSIYVNRSAATDVRLTAAETRLSEAIVIVVVLLITFILVVIFNIYRFYRGLKISHQARERAEEEVRVSEVARAESERFAERVTEAVPNIVYIYDWVENRNVYANREIGQWLGYSPQEIRDMGQNLLTTLMHARDVALLTQKIEQIRTAADNEIVELEYQVRHKDGDWHWLFDRMIVFSRTPDGGVKQYLGVAQDITERKQAEVELLQAKEASEAANKAKSVFLANMSHELRTPLNAILGFAQLMERDATMSPSQQENLAIIGRSGEHLLSLINDVLEMSKIEAGRTTVDTNSFDLHDMLDSLEEMFRLRAEDKGLSLLFERTDDIPQYVLADERKLRQVLINLLNNALKFTEAGSVTLRVNYEDSGAEGKNGRSTHRQIAFEVEDTGSGIAPSEIDSLFEAFTQSESGQKAQEGTGLGLPISRQFVRLMGGEIRVRSEVGQGSRFSFVIEVGVAEATTSELLQAPRRVTRLEPGQPPYRILIAEDKWANRILLRKLLEPIGFEVREAVNGQEAIQLWQEWEPHLIWMDMRMPVMDGYEATRKIKATIQGQATAVIALTASAFEHERAVILSVGCDDFVRKPFREAELLDKMVQHLGVRYLYEEQEPTAVSATRPSEMDAIVTAVDLAHLPADWLARLHQAAAQADAELLLELIDQLDTGQAALAGDLIHLVDTFRFDTLMTLTEAPGVDYA